MAERKDTRDEDDDSIELCSRPEPAAADGLCASILSECVAPVAPTLRSQFSVEHGQGQSLPHQQTDTTANDEDTQATVVGHGQPPTELDRHDLAAAAGWLSAPASSSSRFSRDTRPPLPSYALRAWNPAAPAFPLATIRALDDEPLAAVHAHAPAVVTAAPFGSSAVERIELHREHQRKVAQEDSNAVRLHIGAGDNDEPAFPRLPRPVRIYTPPSGKRWGSKPQVPLASPRIWQGVPKELMAIIASYMDAGSLARFAGTEKLARTVADNRKLWAILAEQPCAYKDVLDGRPPLHYEAKYAHRQYIAQRRRDYIHRRRAHIQHYELALSQAHLWQRGWYCHWIIHFALPMLVALLLLVSFIALIVELDHSRSVGWITFGPLFAAVLIVVLCATPFICWTKRRRLPWQLTDAEKIQLYLPATFYAQTLSPIKNVMEWLGNGSGQTRKDGLPHATFYLMLLVLTVALVNLAVKLSHPSALGWSAFFIPLYVAFALVLAGPWLHWKMRLSDWWRSGHYYRWHVFGGFWIAWGLPLLAFTVMLHLRVDGFYSELSLTQLAIPLWFADGVSLLRMMGRACEAADPCTGCYWLLVWPGGGIAFKILVVLYWETSLSRALLFLPLYPAVLMVLVQGGRHMIDVKGHNDVEWRRTPVHPDPVLLPV